MKFYPKNEAGCSRLDKHSKAIDSFLFYVILKVCSIIIYNPST